MDYDSSINIQVKILLINLPESIDRLNLFTQSAKHYSAEFSVITAIKGSSDNVMHQGYSKRANKLNYYKKLTLGEIGCFLSHRKAWSFIVEHKLAFALVLEDDVMFEHSFQQLDKVIDKINEPWDYINLNEVHEKRSATTVFMSEGVSVVKYNKLPIGASAQVISYSGAEKLLKYTESFSRPLDVELQWLAVDKIKALGIKPYPFKTRKLHSDIDQFGRRNSVSGNPVVKVFNLIKFQAHLFKHFCLNFWFLNH